MTMELSVNVDLTAGTAALPAFLRDVEAAGADMVWVPEAYGRDAVSVLGFCAAATSRVRLGAGVLNVFSRSPALLAQSAAALDELCGGRFELGLGTSGPQVVEGWHGVAFDRPLRRTREVVEVCRSVWRREVLRYDGRTVTLPLEGSKPLKLMTRPVRADIPVWLASLGPRNVRLAAEIAHGWLPTLFVPELADRVWGEDLRAGAAQRDPALPPLRIAAGAHVEVTTGDPAAVRTARDRARPSIARYVGGMGSANANFYNDLVRRYGFTEDADRVRRLYLDHQPGAAADALSDELVEALTVCGPPSYVADRLAAYRAAGVTDFRVNVNAGSDGPRALEALRELC
ncbi:LLM class F420-dependent oxidoreductase [Actinophytocola oryzae]|uniref:Methylenetetrahydromethanopterin reductase n=1 Tax=Actinophytocola oryzae TaxID=502181 RepID=A0A4V3FUU3_9PSEU|nr:LLM class F420-dependent oxidoreductase [Actinophytocola oryzae]TDV56531.1 methylenetetrahydromethanopterin reductase [Actinophytocola oryzae]